MTAIASRARSFLGRPTLARRLGLGFGILVTIMIIVVGVAGWQARRMEQQLDGIVNTQVPRLIKVDALALLIAQLNIAARDAIVAGDDAEASAAISRIEAGRTQVGQQIESLRQALRDTDKRGQEAANILSNESNGILIALVKFTRVVQAHKTDMAHSLLKTAVQPKIEALAGAVEHAQKLQMTMLDEARAASAQASHLALVEIAGALAAAVALAVVLAWRLSASVTSPVNAAVRFAERIAQGDLASALAVERADEIGRLQQALVAMQRRLAGLVRDIRDVADQMAVASDEIASGSIDLSRRTEQTASSLQSTASSMSLLNERVRKSADSAKHANTLARDTTGAAQRGGQVVSQVVASMSDISNTSKRIADITGVIDGISFQTNILALNAAVEAARAGEQGRGFAVVAGEVRSLAQRAANASREIKLLISSSVEKVDSGSHLVQTAGDTMREIVDGVAQVTEIIAGISTASTEQSADLCTVNDTVNQLDGMTQQNSALVEESAASAASMREQSQRLLAMVRAFQF
jgi:methyl-accepting chemotaxis protein